MVLLFFLTPFLFPLFPRPLLPSAYPPSVLCGEEVLQLPNRIPYLAFQQKASRTSSVKMARDGRGGNGVVYLHTYLLSTRQTVRPLLVQYCTVLYGPLVYPTWRDMRGRKLRFVFWIVCDGLGYALLCLPKEPKKLGVIALYSTPLHSTSI